MMHATVVSQIAHALPVAALTRPPRRVTRSSLAEVSHDLKDPLAAIEMALDFALEQEWTAGGTGEPASTTRSIVRRQLAAAHRAAQRMRRLIVATLDRPETDREVPPPAPVGVTDLLDEITEQYAAAARTRRITLEQTCDDDLPGLRVRPDPILRAIGNLIGNAMKFTPVGGQVSVRATATTDGVTITVSDSGPGITAEAEPHLFRRFWQAPETAHLGTGAGLLITRMLVEDEGGTIGYRNRASGGAEFWIVLPAATPPWLVFD